MQQHTKSLVNLVQAGVNRDARWLVRGVSFKVDAGEIVTLIGPNGSGKSTTAKMALGILTPDEGKVERRPDLAVSYVPQKIAIDWTLPLRVNHFMKLTGAASGTDIEEALDLTGVGHLMRAEVRALSGGEFQRVLIARALARKPQLLVLDEPVQGVDFAGEIALYELIGRIRDELNCGIILISHDLHVVMATTDHVVCLNGHICCSGTPQLVSESAEYKTLFGARVASGLAVYEHKHDHTHLPDGRVQHADGRVTNGHMRPPHDADPGTGDGSGAVQKEGTNAR